MFKFVVLLIKVTDNTEEAVGKAVFDNLWDKLAEELNKIGPPNRTSMEWRRVWSVYKYNKKRKRSEHSEPNALQSNARRPNARNPIVRESSASDFIAGERGSLRGRSRPRKTSSFVRDTIAIGNSSNQGNSHLSFGTAFRDFTTTSHKNSDNLVVVKFHFFEHCVIVI